MNALSFVKVIDIFTLPLEDYEEWLEFVLFSILDKIPNKNRTFLKPGAICKIKGRLK